MRAAVRAGFVVGVVIVGGCGGNGEPSSEANMPPDLAGSWTMTEIWGYGSLPNQFMRSGSCAVQEDSTATCAFINADESQYAFGGYFTKYDGDLPPGWPSHLLFVACPTGVHEALNQLDQCVAHDAVWTKPKLAVGDGSANGGAEGWTMVRDPA